MTVFLRSDDSSYDTNTIIEIQVDGKNKYFKNIRSMVHMKHIVNGRITKYSFRNPPHFMNFLHQYAINAHYETDAVLDHYMHHQNTATKIWHLNPSPRYVKEVATSFKTGLYKSTGGEFEYGSGDYGDLGATVAAILLDREARSIVLDADPSYGSFREPLLKLVAYMRAMEFQPFPRSPEIQIENVDTRIGQMAHEMPSVFSFFMPDYAAFGPVRSASLVSPEAQIYITPFIIGLA
eukprot:CAMPEP_0172485260 /NCGR_PEP_ID=MMETSP1066-20121228/13216_1 /TAXON_ID=671091 /ORGANISM="Coscinodiscus wailesii, Strain CCMP2513" /LENGTH=235 /DNA_ID=CAMNT_0013250393 /DNA_START=173 /DNA_END=877 /DNA_ORIENTATION=-